MKEFDPNDPRMGSDSEWASFKPRSGPSGFKMHLGRGPALNACAGEPNYILYEWDTDIDRWIEVTRMENRHEQFICFNCNQDVSKSTSKFLERLSWMFVGKPRLREIGLCRTCRRAFSQMGHAAVDDRFFA